MIIHVIIDRAQHQCLELSEGNLMSCLKGCGRVFVLYWEVYGCKLQFHDGTVVFLTYFPFDSLTSVKFVKEMERL